MIPDPETGMRKAIEAARFAQGHTHPNPAVGAVIWHDGHWVASGYTQPAGGPHAEIEALARFREQDLEPAATTTLFVTMEPCCTHGRTPPCTDAIIRSGIRNVVVGARDANPLHAGRGFEILRAAGIEVTEDVLADECDDLNLIFNHWIVARAPFFAAKMATTLDGRVALGNGDSKWITGALARADVMRWRGYFPAIAVGAGTVVADNPALTVRLAGEPVRAPRRFIFDRHLLCLEQAPDARVFTDEFRARTVLVTGPAHERRARTFAARCGIDLWLIDDLGTAQGWGAFAQRCANEEICGVYFEGGPRLFSSLLVARALHYLFAYRAPKLVGDAAAPGPFVGMQWAAMNDVIQLHQVRHAVFGADDLMRGHIRWNDL